MKGPRDTLARESPRDSPVRENLKFLSLLQVRSDTPFHNLSFCESEDRRKRSAAMPWRPVPRVAHRGAVGV
jgi:hypothetical protein